MTFLVPHRPASALVRDGYAPPAHAEVDTLDFGTVLEVARRRFWLFAAVAALVLVAAVALISVQKPMYTASSAVMMDPRQIQIFQQTQSSPNVSGDLSVSTEAVATQVQVLTSRGMAERVVEALHLDQDPALADPPPGLRAKVMRAVGRPFGLWQPRVQTAQERHQSVVDLVLSRLDVLRLGLTYVIGIKYSDPTPERAAQIANAFADSYIQQSIQGKSDATKQAGGYLNARLRELSDQAAADAAAVQQYRVSRNLLGSQGTLTEQEISGLNGQIASARAEAAADQAKVDTARAQLTKGSSGDDVGAALGSPVIQGLRSQRAVVSGQLAELNSRYGPRYPDVIKAQQQLADIDNGIRIEINRVISNLQANAQVSAKRLASLEGTLGRSRGTLAGNTQAQAGLLQLQQKAASSQQIYDSYLSRFKEIMTSAGTEQSDARIVSQAEPPPTPSSPKVILDLALGAIVAVMLGVIACITAEVIDRSFANGQEVERRLQIPFLGSIPLLNSVARGAKRSPTDYVTSNPFSVFAEGFRNLKVSILQARGRTGATVVAITSPLTSEGKTTTSVCLGETSALQGARTIVVDCDLRRRTLQRFLEAAPSAGLVEVVSGKARLQDVIVVDEKSGLHFLPLADTKMTVDDIFGGEGMDRVLDELRKRYDFIILDTAPLLALADARILAAKTDAVVLLCRWRKTSQDAIRSALRLLQSADAPVAGVALTRVDVRKQPAHGYGDSAYYYRETQAYYAA